MLKISKYQRIGLHVIYWLFAAVFFGFSFWPTHAYPFFALFLIAIILPQTVAVTYTINYILIPRFLFKKRYFWFAYLLVAIIVFSTWINMLSLAFLLLWTDLQIVPTVKDFVVLWAGNYVIVCFAVIVHLLFSTFKMEFEKEALAKRQVETELKLNQANLELLKGQIHPHFLFNVLNNLYGLCLAKSENTCETVLKISELLDYLLYKCNREQVLLAAEIAFLNNYIDLEKMRSDKRLQVEFNVNNKVENQLVPPLLLFPFVENAFKHSALKNTGNRKIDIKMELTKETLHFRVENNFEPHETSVQSGGLGLQNVRKRLGLIFGNNYSLNIETEAKMFRVQLAFEHSKRLTAQR